MPQRKFKWNYTGEPERVIMAFENKKEISPRVWIDKVEIAVTKKNEL